MAKADRFDSGVYGYVKGKCTITVYFPIDKKGEADISCRQCPYYRTQSRTCGLTESVVAFGEKFVGADCPLERVDDDDEQPVEGFDEAAAEYYDK